MNSNKKYTTNQKMLLKFIYNNPLLTRAEISEKTGLSIVSVINFIKSFISDNIVIEREQRMSKGGRRPVTIMINPNYAFVLGIDIGAYSIKIGLTNLTEDIIFTEEILNDCSSIPSKTVSIDFLINKIMSIIKSYNKNKILGIGVGISGIIDYEKKIIKYCPNISGWKNINIQKALGDALKLPIILDTSARWFAISEGISSKENQTIIAILMGYSISAGININNNILRGYEGFAGEIGHMQVVNQNGKQCTCGSLGCLETYVTLPEILSDLTEILKAENLTYNEINSLYQAQNKDVINYFNNIASMVFLVITNIVKIYNPDKIIIDGGVIRVFPQILDLINNNINNSPFEVMLSKVNVEKSSTEKYHVLKGMCYEFAKVFF